MGKEISHILFAEELLHGAGSPIGAGFRSLAGEARHACHLGAIAADTFFYAVRLPFEAKRPDCYGKVIHGCDGNDTSGPAIGMLKALRSAPNDPLFAAKAAFAAGFITHLALDSVIHPFVYHVSGDYYAACPLERNAARSRHRLVESWLDLHLLEVSSLSLAGCPFLEGIRNRGALNRELLRFFYTACTDGHGLDPERYPDLLRGYRVQMALNSRFGNRRLAALVGRANRLSSGRLGSFLALFYPWDYREIPTEILHFESYRHPVTGETRNGGFSGLWTEALDRGREFLRAADAFLFGAGGDKALEEIVRGFSLSSGLVGVPIREATHFDCIPLERLWSHGGEGV